jgi:hypothetical protein
MKGNAMTEMLQEFCDWRTAAMRVEPAAGVIRGVKILGLESRNGRSYLPEALARAAALYENAKVNVNHPRPSATAPRDYQDRIGVIRNVTPLADGLFADFHFNPKHVLAEQLLWDAEHSPENVGFSHNVEAQTVRRGERLVVEAITRVQSVDLVADPATTRGLFESRGADTLDGLAGEPLLEALRRQHAGEVRRLEAEIERLSRLDAAHRKQETVNRLLREFQLPEPESDDPTARAVTSRRFVETLLAAPDEACMRALVEERAALVRCLAAEAPAAALGKAVSRDQYLAPRAVPLDTKAFVAAIT